MGKNLVEYFAGIEDPRRGRVLHNLTEMLVIVTCAMFSEVETFTDIEQWARLKEPWLRRFLRLENGVPSHDTLNRLFRLLNPHAFENVFREWASQVMPTFKQVAIDGKCLRGSGPHPLHLVSAFATDAGMILAQQAVATKGNELDALPDLLQALELNGCLVSLDALGCQREVAKQIRLHQADYLLAVKANQPRLLQTLQDAFADSPQAPEYWQKLLGHGRQTVQIAQVVSNNAHVDCSQWLDCHTLARVLSLRVETGKQAQIQIRYYISSAPLSPEELLGAVRQHWAIENDLHWRLDVMLREDACVVRRDHAAHNLSIVRRFILNLLKQDTAYPKHSMRLRRKMAGWDDDERMRVLGIVCV